MVESEREHDDDALYFLPEFPEPETSFSRGVLVGGFFPPPLVSPYFLQLPNPPNTSHRTE